MEIFLITDRTRNPDRPLAETVREAVEAGVERVQLREKDLGGRELLRMAGELRDVCRAAGARLFVNDRLDVALAAGADGVHLPANGLPVAEVRKSVGDRIGIGVSVHAPEEGVGAEAAGADYLVFGPVFATPAKLRYGPPQGLEPLARLLDRVRVPVYAVGGIDEESVERLRGLPLAGVAVIRAILLSPDIPATVRRLKGI